MGDTWAQCSDRGRRGLDAPCGPGGVETRTPLVVAHVKDENCHISVISVNTDPVVDPDNQ